MKAVVGHDAHIRPTHQLALEHVKKERAVHPTELSWQADAMQTHHCHLLKDAIEHSRKLNLAINQRHSLSVKFSTVGGNLIG